MDSQTVITIVSLVFGGAVIIIILVGVVVVVVAGVAVISFFAATIRGIRDAISGFTGREFRLSNVRLMVVDPVVRVGQESFFYFTWSIENDKRRTISYEEHLTVQDGSDTNKNSATNLSVLSDPISSTQSWKEPGLKTIIGTVRFTLPDGTSLDGSGTGYVRVTP